MKRKNSSLITLITISIVFVIRFIIYGFDKEYLLLFIIIFISFIATDVLYYVTQELRPVPWRLVPKNQPFTLLECVGYKINKGEENKEDFFDKKGEYLYHITFGAMHYTIVRKLPIIYKNGSVLVKINNWLIAPEWLISPEELIKKRNKKTFNPPEGKGEVNVM